MLMKTGILYFTTCFHGFGILRHVDPFVRMLHIMSIVNTMYACVDCHISPNLIFKFEIQYSCTYLQNIGNVKVCILMAICNVCSSVVCVFFVLFCAFYFCMFFVCLSVVYFVTYGVFSAMRGRQGLHMPHVHVCR